MILIASVLRPFFAGHSERKFIGTETILLAEDREEVRLLVECILQDLGYGVLQAWDSATAIELSPAHEGLIHFLMTDVILLKQNGRILYENLCAPIKEIKV